VSLSLSTQKHEALTTASRRVSLWARERLLELLADEPVQGEEVLVACLRADLGHVGSNLNQLVRAVNSG
ncbi:plasmid mobilization protein, partial [Glutamicibacter ardleyensis]